MSIWKCRAVFAGLILGMTSAAAQADWTGAKGLVSVRSESFVAPDYEATTSKNFSFFAAGLKTAGLGPQNRMEILESGLQAHVEGQLSPQEPVLSYLNIRQLYHQEGFLSVGRKLENWSLLDERWNLGIYQPQFRWNPLRPESQGMTGIFARFNGDSQKIPWGILLFGSAISIPDQSAGYSVKNGKFGSENPWFSPPPSQVSFESTGVVDEVNYEVQQPDVSKMIFKQAFAAQAYVGNLNDGLAFQAAYAYKPSNQVALAFDGGAAYQKGVVVKLQPGIFYHSVASADLQYSQGVFETGVGALHDNPRAPEFESPWAYRSFGTTDMISPFAGVKIGNVKMRVMSLHMRGLEETTVGEKADLVGSALPHRYSFGSAYAAEASTRFFWRRHEGVVGKVRYSEGSSSEFAALTGDLQYQIDSRWTLSGAMALVRADQSEAGRRTVFYAYENNDSVQVSASYVF